MLYDSSNDNNATFQTRMIQTPTVVYKKPVEEVDKYKKIMATAKNIAEYVSSLQIAEFDHYHAFMKKIENEMYSTTQPVSSINAMSHSLLIEVELPTTSTSSAFNKNRRIIQSESFTYSPQVTEQVDLHTSIDVNENYVIENVVQNVQQPIEIRPIKLPPRGIKIGRPRGAGKTVFGMKKQLKGSVQKHTNKSSFESLMKNKSKSSF